MNRLLGGRLIVGMILTAAAAVAGADEAKDAAISKDRKLIEGTWKIVALEINGNQAAEVDLRKFRVVNGSDGTWSVFIEGKEVAKGTSVFDPTQMPKTIDFTITAGEGQGQTHLGIYELGERNRKLCFAEPGKARPTEFASKPGSEHVLVLFEKEN